jgi:hypothetical protein
VSIVRKGLSEDPKFAAGYEAIFGKKQAGQSKKSKSDAPKKKKKSKKK